MLICSLLHVTNKNTRLLTSEHYIIHNGIPLDDNTKYYDSSITEIYKQVRNCMQYIHSDELFLITQYS
jgi:hypothetical protein